MTEIGSEDIWPHAPRAWKLAASQEDWPEQLLASVLRRISEDPRTPPVVVVSSASIISDASGEKLLSLVYSRRGVDGQVGYRRAAFSPPAVSNGSDDPVEDTADWIVSFDLMEPLGTRLRGVDADNNGVRWWGAPPL